MITSITWPRPEKPVSLLSVHYSSKMLLLNLLTSVTCFVVLAVELDYHNYDLMKICFHFYFHPHTCSIQVGDKIHLHAMPKLLQISLNSLPANKGLLCFFNVSPHSCKFWHNYLRKKSLLKPKRIL